MTVRELRAKLLKVENQDAEMHIQISKLDMAGECGEPHGFDLKIVFEQPESVLADIEFE